MIDLREALRLVASNAAPLPLQTTKVTNSLGMILGEDIASDVDSPPYEKSLVDGYAVRISPAESASLRSSSKLTRGRFQSTKSVPDRQRSS